MCKNYREEAERLLRDEVIKRGIEFRGEAKEEYDMGKKTMFNTAKSVLAKVLEEKDNHLGREERAPCLYGCEFSNCILGKEKQKECEEQQEKMNRNPLKGKYPENEKLAEIIGCEGCREKSAIVSATLKELDVAHKQVTHLEGVIAEKDKEIAELQDLRNCTGCRTWEDLFNGVLSQKTKLYDENIELYHKIASLQSDLAESHDLNTSQAKKISELQNQLTKAQGKDGSEMEVWMVGVGDCESNEIKGIYATKELAVTELFKQRDRLVTEWKDFCKNIPDDMYQEMIDALSSSDYSSWNNFPHDTPYIEKMRVRGTAQGKRGRNE
jgi:hypothetical protein